MHLFSDNTALRSHVESQLCLTHAIADQSFNLLRQVSEMNLKLARQEIEGALYTGRDIMACSNPMQMVQAAMRQIPPAAERLSSYQQHLLSVLSVLSGGQAYQANLSGAAGSRLPTADGGADAAADEMRQHAAAGRGIGTGNGSASAAGETHH